MKIYSLGNLILGCLLLLVIGFGIPVIRDSSEDERMIVFVIMCVFSVLVYIFRQNIDEWYLGKFPMEMDQKEKNLVNNFSIIYGKLSIEDKSIYEKEVVTNINNWQFILATDNTKEVPYEIKLAISVWMKDLLADTMNTVSRHIEIIVIYPAMFLSPEYKDFHAVEYHQKEKTAMVAYIPIAQNIKHPTISFNIVYYLSGLIWIKTKGIKLEECFDEPIFWNRVEEIGQFNKSMVENILGKTTVSCEAILLICFLLQPNLTAKYFPNSYEKLKYYFNYL